MPFADTMSPEELKNYKGSNPKPIDFDEFWARALTEANNTELNIKRKKADFSLSGFDFEDVYFDGVRNGRIYAKLIKPVGRENLPIALNFHGYTVSSEEWINYISYAAAGFCVLAMDCRGQGGKSTDFGGVSGNTHNGHIIRGLSDGPENLLFRHIYLDTVQLVRLARQLDCTDESRIFAYGGSQGGGLTLACAGLNPEVSLLAPVYPFLCDYKRVWDMNSDSVAYGEIRDYFRKYDPKHEFQNEIFNTLGYIDAVHLSKRIKGETIYAIGLNDEVTPPSTTFAAYNNITAKKELHIYPDFAHEHLPGFSNYVITVAQERLVNNFNFT